ncbi:hypothetical protein PPERSA_07256 [Pseudocohnilembus persalinus]|uniref:Mannose-P-dolichol utilization defect 1 protein homolog n=1 Tax=Pseudocohnilembus persalinus TaxID=266149 RepID=A0A0V0QCZ9_PSEPJ|nr:hypothetical protein PPERSA_07256 [Pseudocohnilembus persalinus]|eukprot:KRX00059.1 hypothetical protein PPERSA_07256 [Pseudocohnilembus persalinus]
MKINLNILLVFAIIIVIAESKFSFINNSEYFLPLKILLFDHPVCLRKMHTVQGIKDPECQQILLTKMIGAIIIIFASFLKLPQIMKIITNKSVAGVSLKSILAETLLLSFAIGVNRWKGNPISVYGEQYLLYLQNLVIAGLFYFYDKKQDQIKLISIVIGQFMIAAIFFLKFLPDQIYTFSSLINIAVLFYSRMTQISLNYKNKSTGQIAGLSLLLELIGTIIRSWTILQEAKLDLIVYVALVNANVLIIILAFQMIYYWNSKENDKFKGNPVKTNRDKYLEQLAQIEQEEMQALQRELNGQQEAEQKLEKIISEGKQQLKEKGKKKTE